MRLSICAAFVVVVGTASADDFPKPVEADFVLKDFTFAAGRTMPELRIHYRTIGKPTRGADGKVNNAVLVLHGTTGSGNNFVDAAGGQLFARVLFGKGQLLDGEKYFIVLPDGIGHGKSAKPSDGLRGR